MKLTRIPLLAVVLLTAAMLPATVFAAGSGTADPENTVAVEPAVMVEPELRDTEIIELPELSDSEDLDLNLQEILVKDPVFLTDGTDTGTASPSGMTELNMMVSCCEQIRTAILENHDDDSTGSNITYIDIKDLGIYNADNEQFHHMGYYCPYADGSNVKVQIAQTKDAGLYSKLVITNNLSAEESEEWVDEIDAALDELLALVEDDTLSVQDQALILHDYMAAHYHYDTTLADYYPSIILTEKEGVCQSYAYLFQYLMNRKGTECYTTTSTSMSHAWNIIAIGDNYYQVDITWDDPVNDFYGEAQHNYFLLSDDTMGDTDHKHSDWDLTKYACSDASYEDDYFTDAASPVVFDGDLRYYIDADDRSLECYDTAASSEAVTVDTLSYWPVFGGTRYYILGFSGLSLYDGRLFYNTCSQIRTYNLTSKKVAVYADLDVSNGYAYGSLIEDGTLTYAEQTTPDVEYTSKTIRSVALLKAHSIKAEDTVTNGTVTVDADEAYEGNTITVTAVPDDGYLLKQIKVTPADETMTAEVQTDVGTNRAEFLMPDCDVTVSAVFVKKCAVTFNGAAVTYEAGTAVKLEADQKSDWYMTNSDCQRVLVASGSTYYVFAAAGDCTVEAVAAESECQSISSMFTNMIRTKTVSYNAAGSETSTYKATVTGQWAIPTNKKISNVRIYYALAKAGRTDITTTRLQGASYRTSSLKTGNGTYSLSVNIPYKYRAYSVYAAVCVTLTDGTTVWSDVVENSLNFRDCFQPGYKTDLSSIFGGKIIDTGDSLVAGWESGESLWQGSSLEDVYDDLSMRGCENAGIYVALYDNTVCSNPDTKLAMYVEDEDDYGLMYYYLAFMADGTAVYYNNGESASVTIDGIDMASIGKLTMDSCRNLVHP